jgi:hypothetical protein
MKKAYKLMYITLLGFIPTSSSASVEKKISIPKNKKQSQSMRNVIQILAISCITYLFLRFKKSKLVRNILPFVLGGLGLYSVFTLLSIFKSALVVIFALTKVGLLFFVCVFIVNYLIQPKVKIS